MRGKKLVSSIQVWETEVLQYEENLKAVKFSIQPSTNIDRLDWEGGGGVYDSPPWPTQSPSNPHTPVGWKPVTRAARDTEPESWHTISKTIWIG